MRNPHFKSTLFCFALLVIPSARADNGWEDHILSLKWENDATAGSDKHYTQGAQISYLSKDDALPGWLKGFSSWVPALGFDVQAEKFGVALTQEIYTPEDLEASSLVVDDRPYAGWLYGTGTLQRRGQTRNGISVMENLKLDLGVIGPESLAEETQKSWHGVAPQGWSHQLKTEPGVNLRYDRSFLLAARNKETHWGADIIPSFDVSAGNVLTYFEIGSIFRAGYNIPNEFATTREPRQFGAYFFTHPQGRWVLRDIFLDGNTFRDSHSVDKRPLVGDVRIGLTVVLKGLEVSVAHTFVSQEFKGEKGFDSYGTATFTVKF